MMTQRAMLIMELILAGSGLAFGFAGGDGSPSNPYRLATQTHLSGVNGQLGASYVLDNDILLSGTYTTAVIAPTESAPFTGTFNGNGHSIKNLKIAGSNNFAALFGVIEDAVVKNLGVENVDVSGGYRVGGLVAFARRSTIDNCHATGQVFSNHFDSNNPTSSGRVGGLVGDNWGTASVSAQILNSYAKVAVTGITYAGGLVGHASTASVMDNCYAAGEVTISGHRAGGLVGNTHGITSRVTINNCYAVGKVVAPNSDRTGGLVGQSYYATITHSYAAGDVIGDTRVGGLVGHATTSSVHENCYASGFVSGKTCVGGLMGYLYGSSALRSSVTESYSTGQATASADYAGGLIGQMENATVSDSYATGSVYGRDEVGGFVGQIAGGGLVHRSYATGAAVGRNLVGGFAGHVSGDSAANDAYSTGSVIGNASVGGFAGRLSAGGSVAQSYSNGAVSGSDAVGGFVGQTWEAMAACFWDMDASGGIDGVGYDAAAGQTGLTALTAVQMQTRAPFAAAGWDFDARWMICENHSCPKLSWQRFAGGDVDFNRLVNFEDLVLLVAQWLEPGDALCGDLSGDGRVDLADFMHIAETWQDDRRGYLDSPYDFGMYQHKVQLHSHTTNSDGALDPVTLMQMYEHAWYGNYTAVAITDHDGLTRNPPFTPSLVDPGGHNIIHIPGIEYTYNNSNASWNHMVAIGVDSIHRSEGAANRQAQINRSYFEGGFTFIAHPHDNHARGWSEEDLLSVCNHYDGIEIHNGGTYITPPGANYPYKVDSVLQAGRRIKLLAVDDFHENFNTTMDRGFIVVNSDLPKGTITADEIMAAIKIGNFFAAGRTSTSNPAPPHFTNITVDGFTITVETDKNTDIEFITNRHNYYRPGPDWTQKYYNVTQAQYTASPDDVFIRIKATFSQSGRLSYAWSNPIYVVNR